MSPPWRRGGASLVLAALAGACGGGEPSTPAGAAAADARRVDLSKAGRITGRVHYEGTPPRNPAIRMAADPVCQRENPDAVAETVVVSDGGLQNVFVYVKDGLNGYAFDTPTEPARLDQKGCRYVPHVLGLRAGQPIEIANSDPTFHNVHALPAVNREFNVGQPSQGMRDVRTFTAPEVMVRVKCDVHAWMHAYVGVVDHPYFAVTADGGTFSLEHVPAGTYTIEAWHEKLGTQTQTVTLGETESKDIAFTFASAAGTLP